MTQGLLGRDQLSLQGSNLWPAQCRDWSAIYPSLSLHHLQYIDGHDHKLCSRLQKEQKCIHPQAHLKGNAVITPPEIEVQLSDKLLTQYPTMRHYREVEECSNWNAPSGPIFLKWGTLTPVCRFGHSPACPCNDAEACQRHQSSNTPSQEVLHPFSAKNRRWSTPFLTLDCFQEYLWGQPKVLCRGLNELLLHQTKSHKRIFALEYSLELHLKTANAAIGTHKRSSKVNTMMYWGILPPNHVNQRNIFSKMIKSVTVAMANYLSL